jgi:hypothetical protein
MAAYPYKSTVKVLGNLRKGEMKDTDFLRYAFQIVSNVIDWPIRGFQRGQQSFGFQKNELIPSTHDWRASLSASGVDKHHAFEIDMPYQVSTSIDGSVWISFTSVGWRCNASNDIRIRVEDVSEIDIMLLCRNILAFVDVEYVYRFLDANRFCDAEMLPRIMTTLIVERGWTMVSSRRIWSSYFAKYIHEQSTRHV